MNIESCQNPTQTSPKVCFQLQKCINVSNCCNDSLPYNNALFGIKQNGQQVHSPSPSWKTSETSAPPTVEQALRGFQT